MTDPFTILLTGDILMAVISVFTNVMDYWFYALILLGFEILVYLKTENITMVAVIGIISIATMSALIPTAGMSFAIIAFFIITAAVFWKIFH